MPSQQTCCGQPGYNSGDRAAGRQLALQFLQYFEAFDAVVIPSGSCTAMIRREYPRLFEDDPELAQRLHQLGQRTHELSEFLLAHPFELPPSNFTARLTFHDR